MAGRSPLMQCRIAPNLLERIELAAARAGMTRPQWLRSRSVQCAESELGPPTTVRADPYAKLAAKTRARA